MNDDNETKHIAFINEEISSINKQRKANSSCLYLSNMYQINFFDIIPNKIYHFYKQQSFLFLHGDVKRYKLSNIIIYFTLSRQIKLLSGNQ